ncbi:MAG: DUF58 domain-containing protein [Sphingobacteriaceae bacterium]
MPEFDNHQELQRFANLELLAKQIVEGFVTGLHQSPFHGFSVEFAEHRLYNNGESTRNIDWKLFARTDKLFVKQYEEETNLRSYLVLDTSSSMNFAAEGISKMLFSVHAAAALIYLFKKQRDSFGLALFSENLDWLSSARSTSAHLHYLFVELEKAANAKKKNDTTNIAGALHHLAEQLHKRSMIIIFSDMLENAMDEEKSLTLFASLQHLKYNKHEVIIFNVTDHQHELAFGFDNRPYHFVDLENNESLRVHAGEIREAYVTSIQQYRQQLTLKCAQYHIDLIDANIHEGYEEVLKRYLIKRNSMA